MNRNLTKALCLGALFLLVASFSLSASAITAEDVVSRGRWDRDSAPAVEITNPTNGATVEGIVHITVVASDDIGVVSVSITVNGETQIGTEYYWDTTSLADGNYVISAEAVDTIDQVGTDSITVVIGDGSGGEGDGIVNKYAIIIGISDYEVINDLGYCDEDASDWYNYLNARGWQITLLGDGTSPYPRAIDGLATEYNIKQAVANVITTADEDDIIAYTSSGHGAAIKSGSGRTATYKEIICAWDISSGEDGEDGYLYDYEFASMWAPAVSKTFIFLDHCNSGGMNELFDNFNSNLFYMVTTCTAEGYGYDVPAFYNGMWTYYYLELGLIGQGFTALDTCFDWSHDAAVADGYDGKDEPMEFGIPGFTF